MYWYACMICGKNQIDCLHHILSESSRLYIDGAHNESTYNSSPVHNQICHIGNEAFLYDSDNIKMLLKKTRDALTEMGYSPKPVDKEFLRIYAHLYG